MGDYLPIDLDEPILGSFKALQERKDCNTCRQIVHLAGDLASDAAPLSDRDVYIRQVSCPILPNHKQGGIYQIVIPHRLSHWHGTDIDSFPNEYNSNVRFILRAPTAQPRTGINVLPINLIDPRWIDVERIRKIMDECDTNHAGTCHRLTAHETLGKNPLRHLIDLHRKRLIPATGKEKYVALSYIWGNPPQTHMTTRSNFHESLEYDSFNPDNSRFNIPQTIQDAMRFAIAMGYEFLWVDRYCIVQDEEEQKMAQIHGMGSIFANADLAIVAADGDDLSHGLPGVGFGSQPREEPQVVLKFGSGCELVKWTADPMLLGQSIWASRGWTFQEQLFSPRMVIFRRGRAEWRCRQYSMPEEFDLKLKTGDCDILHKGLGMKRTTWPNYRQYIRLVEAYCKRRLTYEADALLAFSGALNMLAPSFLGGFIYGLPELFFDAALLWQSDGLLRQRFPFGPSFTEAGLPSWSWAQWQGEPRMGHCHTDFQREEDSNTTYVKHRTYPLVEWYKISRASGRREKIINSFAVYRDSGELPNGWSLTPTLEVPPVYVPGHPCNDPYHKERIYHYRHESDPEQTFWYPIPLASLASSQATFSENWMPYIQTHTNRAFLQVREVGRSYHSHWVCLLGKSDDGGLEVVGAICINRRVVGKIPDGKLCEVIAISEGMVGHTYPLYHRTSDPPIDFPEWHWNYLQGKFSYEDKKFRFYRYYNVLWVERHDGISYRKALGRVEKSLWEKQNLEGIDVTLG